jgi:hypothetical protein
MLQVTTPAGGDTNGSPSSQLANAAFVGALVLHIWAGELLHTFPPNPLSN